MTDKPEEPYRVGPGKPPKSRMWKKGQSGNPKGRPRKKEAETIYEEFLLGLLKKRKVKIGDEVKEMTMRELIVEQVLTLAAKADKRAIDAILKADLKAFELKVQKYRPGGVLLVGMSGEPTPAAKARGLTLMQELEEHQRPFRTKTPPPPGHPAAPK